MARSTGLLAAILALFLIARAAKEQEPEQPYVYNTVTAVADLQDYITTIKIFVETHKCAIDNNIFLQDFLTCDFSWVEDAVAGKKVARPAVTCPRKCAIQWEKITDACYKQFRDNMESDERFGKLAERFFELCDTNTKKDVVSSASIDDATDDNKPDKGASTGGADKPATGTVSANSMDGTPTTAPASAPEDANPPATSTATAATPSASDDGEEEQPIVGGSDSEEPATTIEDEATQSNDIPTSMPEDVEMPNDAHAVVGAEAPTIAYAPGPGPAVAPAPEPMPNPETVPIPDPAPVATSGTLAASANFWAAAVLGLMLLL